ncbi:MAG: hypothetical protein NT165_02700 [Candidatus Falkowbacteria bacterium]|nr:hypothetical protein [Candidatus Falkowbacteria bacterium]
MINSLKFRPWLKKWRYLFAAISFSLVATIMFFYSVTSNLWLSYPMFLRMPLAFEKLSLSVFREPICHEDCAISRLISREVLVESLKSGNQRVKNKILRALREDNEDVVFKIELLRAWREAFDSGDLSPELLAIFRETKNQSIRNYFQENFQIPPAAWLEDERAKVLDKEADLFSREASLLVLARKDPEFFAWLSTQDLFSDDKFLQPLLKAMIFAPAGQGVNQDFFKKLWPLLSTSNEKTKNTAIFLARAKISDSESGARNFLIAVYHSEIFSIFSRSFAAEILNLESGQKDFSFPEIGDQEWEKYFASDNL